MLPLWIIDLREKSDRRESFETLLGQIDHVHIDRDQGCDATMPEVAADAGDGDNEEMESIVRTPADAVGKEGNPIEPMGLSVEEAVEHDEKRKADKESMIDGCWWRYSPMGDKDYHVDITQDVPRTEAAADTAERLYEFQADLITEGQKFIRGLRESNAPPDMKFNVVVLGDLNEAFTRLVFPSVAGLLQKEKGRLLPHHIHQGMEIIGSIYIPSDINTLPVHRRESMKRTLLEIDVQHKVADMRGYDHVMIYQDVQVRTDCHYSALSGAQIQEYLLQCLVHLYYATDSTHPLLSGTRSAEDFYFSMGAASVEFDVENEDLKARHRFGMDFMRSLKTKGSADKPRLDLSIFTGDDYAPENMVDFEAVRHLDREEVRLDEPVPHPVRNWWHKYLKRNYYNRYLRDFTRNLMTQVTATIEDSTRGALEILSARTRSRYETAGKHIFDRLRDVFTRLEASDGGLPTIIDLFKQMQDGFSARKKDIAGVMRTRFWQKVETEEVPRDMQDPFMEYHDAYEEDIRHKTGGTHQTEMKKEAVTELNNLLGVEATVMSRVNRSVLLGIMLALALVPVLNMLSPHFIDLGRVRRYSEWWASGIFCLPVLWQLWTWFRFERRKRKAVNRLKALFLHDAFARVANRIESEIRSFYDRMIALGDLYIKRTEAIRDELEKGYEDLVLVRPVLPFTMFNQPLLGGRFGHDELLAFPQAADTEIRINYIPYRISEITDREYFLFLNQHRSIVMDLYRDVELCENLVRRIDDGGAEVLVTKEEQLQERQSRWRRYLQDFHTHLGEVVRDSLVPRIHDTVGEFLVANIHGYNAPKDVLEPMVGYAANNGEATSSADVEMADLKVNTPSVVPYVYDYISTPFKYEQVSRHSHLYSRYIFLTRWRSFEEFPLNRILPMEDFDEAVRSERVYSGRRETGQMDHEENSGRTPHLAHKGWRKRLQDKEGYFPYPSTLLLWSLAPDDSSAEWFRLLDSDFFAESYDDKEIYRKVLNPDD